MIFFVVTQPMIGVSVLANLSPLQPLGVRLGRSHGARVAVAADGAMDVHLRNGAADRARRELRIWKGITARQGPPAVTVPAVPVMPTVPVRVSQQ